MNVGERRLFSFPGGSLERLNGELSTKQNAGLSWAVSSATFLCEGKTDQNHFEMQWNWDSASGVLLADEKQIERSIWNAQIENAHPAMIHLLLNFFLKPSYLHVDRGVCSGNFSWEMKQQAIENGEIHSLSVEELSLETAEWDCSVAQLNIDKDESQETQFSLTNGSGHWRGFELSALSGNGEISDGFIVDSHFGASLNGMDVNLKVLGSLKQAEAAIQVHGNWGQYCSGWVDSNDPRLVDTQFSLQGTWILYSFERNRVLQRALPLFKLGLGWKRWCPAGKLSMVTLKVR